MAAEFDADDEEVLNFLTQSHISAENVARLRRIAASANARRAEWAAAILEVALVAPYKRRRLKRLARGHRDLLAKLVRCGLTEAAPPPREDFAPAAEGPEDPFDERF